eukprot:2019545-Pleurochrysis_carterae.AAC.9
MGSQPVGRREADNKCTWRLDTPSTANPQRSAGFKRESKAARQTTTPSRQGRTAPRERVLPARDDTTSREVLSNTNYCRLRIDGLHCSTPRTPLSRAVSAGTPLHPLNQQGDRSPGGTLLRASRGRRRSRANVPSRPYRSAWCKGLRAQGACSCSAQASAAARLHQRRGAAFLAYNPTERVHHAPASGNAKWRKALKRRATCKARSLV